jgi:integrase
MPFDDVPAFLLLLRQKGGVPARALEFTILTAARSGEVLGARWDEVKFHVALWTVPAARTKGGREHRIPLSRRAIEILEEMQELRRSEFVFPGVKSCKPMSVTTMADQLRRLKVDATVHGFRSAFRDWAGERTSFPREVAEAALAHLVGDEVERAYRRGDALEKRRQIMNEWESHCSAGSAPLGPAKVGA